MAMLAAPRRKQKWTINPRGKDWSDDSNKYGQKMLEKFGWKSGKGLGANEQGMTEHVRVKFKDDSAGIGFSKDDMDKNWVETQDDFSSVLATLAKAHQPETETVTEPEQKQQDIGLSGLSLEMKSEQSRKRVHYRKFTRGKDVNKYSAKDLANIFGKTELTTEPAKKKIKIEEKSDESLAPIGEADTTGGVLTYKGGNMSDYFKNKIPTLMTKNQSNEKDIGSEDDDDDESSRYVGFGFSSDTKKTSHSNAYAFDNPALDTNDNNKIKSEFCFDNPALDLNSKTNDSKNFTKINEFKKINFTKSESDLVKDVVEYIPKENTDTMEKKIKKKKSKKNKDVEGFVNDALDLDTKSENSGEIVVSKKPVDDFEVSRSDFGLSNDALDITDEIKGKKRVTFNNELEFNTDLSKKKKSKNKLDKFEIDNEKLKKKKEKKEKKKKEKDQSNLSLEENNVFVNEALDVEIINEEINDNEANEKKSKKSKRKRSRRMSNLETIEEAPEEEKEVSTLNSNDINEPPKKKKKKNKDLLNSSIEIIHVKDSADKETEKNNDDDDIQEVEVVAQETKKKSKKKKKKKNNKVSDEVVEIQISEEITIDDDNSNKENQEKDVVADDVDNEKKKSKKNKRSKKTSDLIVEQVEDGDGKEKVSKVIEDKQQLGARKIVKNSTAAPTGDKAKKKIKSFFTKSFQNPVLNFSGSNINDIKGYGVKG